MKKTIFITGANGFLGSRIVKAALKKKYIVKAFVRKDSDLENIKNLDIKICYGDLRDKDSIEESIKGSNIICHVAADYRLWARKSSEIYESNVFGTENIIKAATKFSHEKFLLTSSVATLGTSRDKSTDEKSNANFSNMIGDYKKSKYIAEKIFFDYVKKKLIKGIVLNPSTPIGPGDIKPTPTGRIIFQMLTRSMPAFVETGLNFVHVDDVAEGHFLALKNGKIGERYILGGENMNFKEFLDKVASFANVPAPKFKIKTKFLYPLAYLNELYSRINKYRDPMLTVNGLRMSEELMFFSSEKAKSQLGYRPRNINNAIKESVIWMKEYFNLK